MDCVADLAGIGSKALRSVPRVGLRNALNVWRRSLLTPLITPKCAVPAGNSPSKKGRGNGLPRPGERHREVPFARPRGREQRGNTHEIELSSIRFHASALSPGARFFSPVFLSRNKKMGSSQGRESPVKSGGGEAAPNQELDSRLRGNDGRGSRWRRDDRRG